MIEGATIRINQYASRNLNRYHTLSYIITEYLGLSSPLHSKHDILFEIIVRLHSPMVDSLRWSIRNASGCCNFVGGSVNTLTMGFDIETKKMENRKYEKLPESFDYPSILIL